MDILGFDSYDHVLKLYLKKYRDVVKQSEKGEHFEKEEEDDWGKDSEET